jgi:type VI secretion system VasD/TssJ family lipoprotein
MSSPGALQPGRWPRGRSGQCSIVVMSVLLAGGCQHARLAPCEARGIRLTIVNRVALSSSDRERDMIHALWVFQLESTTKFEKATAKELRADPEGFLGPDLLDLERHVVDAGERLERTYPRKSPTSNLGAMTLLRGGSERRWRTVVGLPDDSGAMCTPSAPRLEPLEIKMCLIEGEFSKSFVGAKPEEGSAGEEGEQDCYPPKWRMKGGGGLRTRHH